MSYDLRAGLDALTAADRAAAPDLPIAALRTRARRRRTTRIATTAASSLVAVGAIAIAAVALPGRDAPQPAASLSPTPSPTQTAEFALPTAVTLERPATCGEPLPPVLQSDGEPELALSADVPLTLTTNDRLVVDYTLTLPRAAVPTLYVDRPVLALVSGGAVVATGTTPESAMAGQKAELDLAACDTGERLGEGAYAAYLVQPLLRIVDGTVTDEALLVVAGPYPLTVEPATEPHPALEDLVISTSGLGPLTVGLPPIGNPGEAMIEYHENYCSDIVESDGSSTLDPALDPGLWLAAGYDGTPTFWTEDLQDPFRVSASAEAILRIDVRSLIPRTAGGVGIGSSLEDLLAAHPDVVEMTEMSSWSRAWVLQGDAGTLVFETADDLDGYLPELTEETVISIRVTAQGVDFPRHTLGTGNVAANCGLT